MAEGCRDAVDHAAGVAQLPQNAVLDAEAASGFRDADAGISSRETVSFHGVQETLALFTVRRFGGQSCGYADDLVPVLFEKGLCRLVGIDEKWIGCGTMGEDTRLRRGIEPARAVTLRAFENGRVVSKQPLVTLGKESVKGRV